MLRVCFDCYGVYTTDSVYQWDLNHSLEISGKLIDSVTSIHFTNKKRDTAIVVNVEVKSGTIIAPIPNELLEEPYNVIAYAHTYDENQAKTIEVINIPVIKRVKPDDYQFIENVDVMNFERLEKDIQDFIQFMDERYLKQNNEIVRFETEVNETLADIKRETLSIDGRLPGDDPETGRAYIKPRRGTAKLWAEANPVLLEGEIGIELPEDGSGLVRIKFGDGVTPWNELEYGVMESEFSKEYGSSIHAENVKNESCFLKVYGNTTQAIVSSKNQLDTNDFSFTLTPGATISVIPFRDVDGKLLYISIKGTTSEQINLDLGTFYHKANVLYTISIGAQGSVSTFGLTSEATGSVWDTRTFERLTNGSTTVKLIIFAGATFDEEVRIYPQIEEGETATEYEPFTKISPSMKYPEDLNGTVISEFRTCRKNELNNTLTSTTLKGVTFTVNSDKSITMNGSTTERIDRVLGTMFCKKGVKYLVKGIEGGSTSTYAIWSSASGSIYSNTKGFTVEEDGIYTFNLVVFAGANISNVTIYPIIYNSNITDYTYEPYTESVATLSSPITLNGLNGVKDYFDTLTGELERKLKKVVFDGSDDENWQLKTDDENYYQFYITVPGALNSKTVVCTHFTLISISDRGTTTGFVSYSDNAFRFALLPDLNITTLAEWKEWLSSNPVEVMYILAEPEITTLSEFDLKNLRELKSFEGVTNVYNDANADMEYIYGTTENTALTLDNRYELTRRPEQFGDAYFNTVTLDGEGTCMIYNNGGDIKFMFGDTSAGTFTTTSLRTILEEIENLKAQLS